MLPTANRPTLKPAQLRLIQEIAQRKQLQSAAEALAMTQSAASHMLAEVEARLGASLFLRHPKGMTLTESGEAVLRRVQAILHEMNGIATDLNALREGDDGLVRVGAVTGPAVRYLAPAIREVKRLAPDADITVDVAPSRELLERLSAGEMDFILARILPEFDSRDFNIRLMNDEKVVFCARAQHPLAQAGLTALTDLLDYEWIMQQRGAPIREATLATFAALGLSEPRNILNSPSLLMTIAYLAQSDAVAPLSDEVAQLLSRPPVGGGLAVLPIPHEIRVSPYYLLALRRRQLSPLALRLWRSVEACAAEECGGSGRASPPAPTSGAR